VRLILHTVPLIQVIGVLSKSRDTAMNNTDPSLHQRASQTSGKRSYDEYRELLDRAYFRQMRYPTD